MKTSGSPSAHHFRWQQSLGRKPNQPKVKNVVIPATGSDLLVHMDAVEPACHYDGNIEYWVCYECEQVWQDEALTQLTNIKNVVLPATGAEVTHVEAVEATCTTMGNIEYWYCETCMQVWQDENLTQLTNMMNVKLGYGDHSYFYPCDPVCQVCYEYTNPDATHTVVHVEAKESTCSAFGNVEYWYCSDCGAAWLDEAQTMMTNQMSVKLPMAEHTGYEADYKCDVCSAVVAPAADSTLTFAQASALGVAGGTDTYTTDKYYVIGHITSIYQTTYGNMYIVDEQGNEFTIYGTYSADGKTGYSSLTDKPVAGDYVTFYGIIGNYKGGAQMKNGWMTEVVKHADEGCTWVDATCLVAKHCKYCGATEGALADHTYVNGVCSVCEKVADAEPLANASLSFTNKENRTVFTTEQQVWEQNGVKFINNKASSTSNVADYAAPVRIYANSEIIVEGAGMTKIEFTCGSTSYATVLQNSIGTVAGATVTVSGSVVTVEFETAVEQFKIAKVTAQTRFNSILVNG